MESVKKIYSYMDIDAVECSIMIFPYIMFWFLAGTLIASMVMVGNPYQKEIGIIILMLALLWSSLLVWGWKKLSGFRFRGNVKLAIFCTLLISYFVTGWIWGFGYLSLQPTFNIDNGIQHTDTLFHSAIAESFSRSIVPLNLINGENIIHYHVISHGFMYIISSITGIPPFFVYNYLYPLIFIPLFFLSVFYAVSRFKFVLSGRDRLTVADILLVSFFMAGFAQKSWLDKCSIRASTFIISESFLVANTMVLFFYGYVIGAVRKSLSTTKKKFILLAVIPFTTVLVSGAKISVGMVLLACVSFYLLRIYGKKLWSWSLVGGYSIVFYLCLYLFNDRSDGSTTHIIPFAFYSHCSGPIGFIMHYILLSAMLLLTAYLGHKEIGLNWKKLFYGREGIWVQLLVFVAFVCFLPGLVFDIAGGNAAYFSYSIEIPSLLILCGLGYMDRLGMRNEVSKLKCEKYCKILVVWLIVIVFSTPTFPLRKLNLDTSHKSQLYAEAMALRERVQGQTEKYIIFIDDTAELLKIYDNNQRSIPFLYPALTGVGVINASYYHNGTYKTITGLENRGYGLMNVTNDRLTLEQAKEKAKLMGKQYMIVVSSDGYEYINLQ